ncbi:MAG: hypothetical protein JSV25_00380 [Spirochaetota bacterium]|nr:MAG: hypothetical protein JSV25_00380 [Spirochaetota bacterium]
MKQSPYKGIVVFDVDGVIYKDIFLKKIVQSRGFINYLKIIILGWRYFREHITLDGLLREGYKLAGNITVQEAQEVANEIKITTTIKPAIKVLHQNGYLVSLISAGIPNFVLKKLAQEIGADHYTGLDIEESGGEINVEKIHVISKVDIADKLIQELGLEWDQVVSVGDDPGNIALLKKSRIGIGFNPVKSVRDNSDVVIEGNNFLEILPYIIPQEKLPKTISISRFNWRRELFRKVVHLGGCAIPFIARYNKILTSVVLLAIIVIYLISELMRTFGLSFSLFSQITRRAQRHSERRGIVYGPILLGLGIAMTIVFFKSEIYIPAVLVVSISDSISALVGRRWGKIHIFGLRNRTVEGSTAFFVSAFIILYFYFPLPVAIMTTIVAAILELVPVYNMDNLLIPVGTALFLLLYGI